MNATKFTINGAEYPGQLTAAPAPDQPATIVFKTVPDVHIPIDSQIHSGDRSWRVVSLTRSEAGLSLSVLLAVSNEPAAKTAG